MKEINNKTWNIQYLLFKEEYEKLINAADEAKKYTYPNAWWYATAIMTRKWNIYP